VTTSLLLDTTTFSAVLRKDPAANFELGRALAQGSTVLVSPVVYYELRRGLLKRNALRLLQALDALVARLLWIDVTRSDWETAAALWVRTQRAGRPHHDADLLIAAQANNRGAVVITANVKDFVNVALLLESW